MIGDSKAKNMDTQIHFQSLELDRGHTHSVRSRCEDQKNALSTSQELTRFLLLFATLHRVLKSLLLPAEPVVTAFTGGSNLSKAVIEGNTVCQILRTWGMSQRHLAGEKSWLCLG